MGATGAGELPSPPPSFTYQTVRWKRTGCTRRSMGWAGRPGLYRLRSHARPANQARARAFHEGQYLKFLLTKQTALGSHPADLQRHVDELRQVQGDVSTKVAPWRVSCVYHGQAEALCKQRVVVVDVPVT